MSTIHINLQNICGVAVAAQVVFAPQDTPFIDGTALTASGAQSAQTAANGTGSIVLEPGRYSVTFIGIAGNTDSLIIGVPDDNNTYELTQIINRGAVIPSPPLATVLSTGISDATAAGRELLTAPDVPTQRADLGLATVAASGSYNDLTNLPVLGTAAAQAASAFDAAGAAAAAQAASLQRESNLSDLASAPAARANLKLGDAATHAATDFATAAQGAEADEIIGVTGLIKIVAGVPGAAIPFVDYVPASLANAYRFTSEHGLEIYNATTGLWNALTVSGPAGSEVVGLAAGNS